MEKFKMELEEYRKLIGYISELEKHPDPCKRCSMINYCGCFSISPTSCNEYNDYQLFRNKLNETLDNPSILDEENVKKFIKNHLEIHEMHQKKKLLDQGIDKLVNKNNELIETYVKE
jgi:hypothetical protein